MRRVVLVLAFGVILAGASLAPAVASGSKPKVFPPLTHPYGKSYGEWQARWFKWVVEIPAATNPLFDETGQLCALGQRGPVWFGAPVFHLGVTERSCTIPEGKAFLVPVAGVECSNIEPPPFFGETKAELRECAASGFEEFFAAGISASFMTVDGRAVPSLERFRTQTPIFSFTLPEDNIFGMPGPITATKAVSDGIFVIVKPLSEGRHRVVMHGEDSFGGVVDEIYNLTVDDDEDEDDD